VIKGRNIIWPSKWMSNKIKLMLVLVMVLLWCGIGLYKYLILDTTNMAHLASIILVYAISCFIYDKDYPIGTIALNFEDGSEGSQIGRFLSALLALVFYMYVMFSSSF